MSETMNEEPVRCTCGAQPVRPYPNDCGPHSTTECPAPTPDDAEGKR